MENEEARTRILFVCLGNVCRSPAAEAVTRGIAARRGLALALDSAGTAGWHAGKPPYAPMRQAARRRGIEMDDLRARRFDPADFSRFDLICAMDGENIADIEALRPPGNETPLRLLTDFLPSDSPHAGADHVPDPYYTRDFEGCLDQIEAAAEGLVSDLSARRGR